VIVGVYNTKSNEYRWLKVDAVPQFRLGENRPYQVYTLFDDVTERKKAEKALKENEAILHSFFESPGTIRGILEIFGDNVRLVSHNREAASFYGWRDRSVDGKPLGEIGFTKEEERSWVKNLNDARMASRPLSFEYARDTDSGRQWILFTLGRIEIETTTNPRFAFAGTDITRRKQIENESRETRDYLDSLLNYANAPIIVWDSEFKIKGFNHAFERLTGLSSNEVVGKNLDILFPQEKKEEAMAHILRTLAGEYWEAVEIPIIRTDGTVRTALWNSANVCDTNSKKIIATIAQGQDITERKKLEEKLKIAERMAGIGETAAMVGHDIRNPLQAILGYCSVAEELLNVETNDESHRKKLMEIFEQVKDQVRYTDKIVSNLRDYSTPVTAVPVRTDLRQLIEESRSLSHIPQTVIVSVNIPKTFHNAKVDPSILKRVLVNLVTNAVQAMPNGGRLSVKVARRKNPATLVLSVGDTGVGIPKEDRSRIFVPLFTTKAKGQGLGLSACKCLIEAHDGTITFKSQTGKGSQFIIKIPLKKDR
jgi:PAS domain S-box-containing protein